MSSFHLLDPLGNDYGKLSEIFQQIFNKNAVSFLGAGASIANKKLLSKDIIELYEAKINKKFGTSDIIKFVDILQSTPGLRRADFDRFVIDNLAMLEPNQGHKTFVTIPWKQIITTNFDTLIEQAHSQAKKDNTTEFNLKLIKTKAHVDYQPNNSELVYIKLNGCMSDIALYPLVFSSQEFTNQTAFYKKVLSPYRSMGDEVLFIAFGYSFTDQFAEHLIKKMFSTDFRQKRILYCVDPYPNEDNLAYYQSQDIAMIKISFEQFFESYKRWFEENHKSYIKSLQKFTNPDQTGIRLDTNVRLFLDNSLIQLKDDYRVSSKLSKTDYYNGEEPNYQIIVDRFDVVKKNEIENLLVKIDEAFNNTSTNIPPLILVGGDFGSGKTTFTLRAIYEYLKKYDDALGFEIIKTVAIKRGYLNQVIKQARATKFIFYCDNIETDSVFKSFNDIRIDLATEQYSDIKILFISSIRENILAQYKNSRHTIISNCIEFNYSGRYTKPELEELVENLKGVGLVEYRDTVEKGRIVSDLLQQYNGDSFISLYKLIQNGSHYKYLQKAFNELTVEVKQAFKLTALVHRFNMDCPVSIIKNAIRDITWEEFRNKIVKGDGKKILFNEFRPSMGNEPDIFFRTKHSVIAEALVKTTIKNSEKNSLYKSIFSSLVRSEYNAGFVVDLLKNIRTNDADITEGQIEVYYNICKEEFETHPHFMVSYITHIEKRSNSIKQLQTCINEITLLEGELEQRPEQRNHRLIHRKGSLNFKIARLMKGEGYSDVEILKVLDSAEEWFKIKQKLDFSSSYSYVDYLNMLIWKMAKISLDQEHIFETNLTIRNLFDDAFRVLVDNVSAIQDLFEEYRGLVRSELIGEDYEDFLLGEYQNPKSRSIATMLLYYYYYDQDNIQRATQFIPELETYLDNKDVVYFLFKYYGRNLHIVQNRIKFFEVIRNNRFLEDQSPLRYNYFNGICEAYNYRWSDSKESLSEIRGVKQSQLNPDFFLYWRDNDGELKVFVAEVIANDKGVKKAQVNRPFFRQFFLISGDYNNVKLGDVVDIYLKFFLDGVKAEIVKKTREIDFQSNVQE